MGWGFILMFVMAAYVICSLLLTIHVTAKGKLDWIGASGGLKYLIIGIGWLCLMAGSVYVTMINSDWQDMSNANAMGIILIRYGGLWIPLLMLIPYAILLRPEWQQAVSPNVYKIPLLAGCLIGLMFLLINRTQLGMLLKNKGAVDSQKYEKALKQINQENSTAQLLYYMLDDTDPRLTQAALKKVQAKTTLVTELQTMLNQCADNFNYFYALAYLEKNNITQPDSFITPLNTTITHVATELKYRLQSFGDEINFLQLLNVDGICHILDSQFSTYRDDFRPALLQLQSELANEPQPKFADIRNKYREAVNRWLEQGCWSKEQGARSKEQGAGSEGQVVAQRRSRSVAKPLGGRAVNPAFFILSASHKL